MPRLSDLSVEELARLLNLSNVEAAQLTKWINKWTSKSLMNTSVEEIKCLRERGELHNLNPDLPRVPKDAILRWRQLRELLLRESEFETRYPVAYSLLLHLPLDFDKGARGLPLASFNVRVARYDPRPHTTSAVPHEGDEAYFSSEKPLRLGEVGPSEVDWSFSAPDPAYLRGVLLAVLSREEYQE